MHHTPAEPRERPLPAGRGQVSAAPPQPPTAVGGSGDALPSSSQGSLMARLPWRHRSTLRGHRPVSLSHPASAGQGHKWGLGRTPPSTSPTPSPRLCDKNGNSTDGTGGRDTREVAPFWPQRLEVGLNMQPGKKGGGLREAESAREETGQTRGQGETGVQDEGLNRPPSQLVLHSPWAWPPDLSPAGPTKPTESPPA